MSLRAAFFGSASCQPEAAKDAVALAIRALASVTRMRSGGGARGAMGLLEREAHKAGLLHKLEGVTTSTLVRIDRPDDADNPPPHVRVIPSRGPPGADPAFAERQRAVASIQENDLFLVAPGGVGTLHEITDVLEQVRQDTAAGSRVRIVFLGIQARIWARAVAEYQCAGISFDTSIMHFAHSADDIDRILAGRPGCESTTTFVRPYTGPQWVMPEIPIPRRQSATVEVAGTCRPADAREAALLDDAAPALRNQLIAHLFDMQGGVLYGWTGGGVNAIVGQVAEALPVHSPERACIIGQRVDMSERFASTGSKGVVTFVHCIGTSDAPTQFGDDVHVGQYLADELWIIGGGPQTTYQALLHHSYGHSVTTFGQSVWPQTPKFLKRAAQYMKRSRDELLHWYDTEYVPAAYKPANADASTKPPIFARIRELLLELQAQGIDVW